MREQDLITSFNDSFYNENLLDLGINIGDACIDLVSKSDVIGAIPILGVLCGLYKTYKNIETARLFQKVYVFLYTTKDIPVQDKEAFINQLSIETQDRGSEFLLDFINRLDSIYKAELLANLVKNKIMGNVTIMEFTLLCKILENIPVGLIKVLPSYVNEQNVSGETDMLYSCGLLYMSSLQPDTCNKYKLNKNGYMLLKYCLNTDIKMPEIFPIYNAAFAVLS